MRIGGNLHNLVYSVNVTSNSNHISAPLVFNALVFGTVKWRLMFDLPSVSDKEKQKAFTTHETSVVKPCNTEHIFAFHCYLILVLKVI